MKLFLRILFATCGVIIITKLLYTTKTDAKNIEIKLKDLKKANKYDFLLVDQRKKLYPIGLPFPLPVLVKRQPPIHSSSISMLSKYNQKPPRYRPYVDPLELQDVYPISSSSIVANGKRKQHIQYKHPIDPYHDQSGNQAKHRYQHYQPLVLRPVSKSMLQLSPSKYYSHIGDEINQVYPSWEGEQNREILGKLISGQGRILFPSRIQLDSLILTPKQLKNSQTEDNNENDTSDQNDTSSNSHSKSNTTSDNQQEPANKPSASELYMSALRPALDYGEALYRLRTPRFVQLAPLKPIYSRPIAMLQPPLAVAANTFMSLVEPQLVAPSSQSAVSNNNDGFESLSSSSPGGATLLPIMPMPIADPYQERLVRAVQRARQLEAGHRVALVKSTHERMGDVNLNPTNRIPRRHEKQEVRLVDSQPVFLATHQFGIPLVPTQIRLLNY